MKPRLLVLVGLVACAFVACSSSHVTVSGDPVYARVVDADTGKPIQGVAVVAYWELYRGGVAGGRPCGAANVEEALTDKDGRFYIAGWGPIKAACGYMYNMNPFTYLFKPGYAFAYMPGGDSLDVIKLVSEARVSWAGATIKMHKFPNLDLRTYGRGSYADNFIALNSELDTFIVEMPAECNWEKIPYMLKAIIAQTRAFIAAGNHNFNGSISLTLSRDDQDKFMQKLAPQCGSPKAFVRRLEQ